MAASLDGLAPFSQLLFGLLISFASYAYAQTETTTAGEVIVEDMMDLKCPELEAVISETMPVRMTGCPKYRNLDPQTTLLRYLRKDYAMVSPQCYLDLMDSKDAMDIQITLNMLQLMDVNEVDQAITISLHFEVIWADCRLTWNTSEYKTEDLEIPPDFPLWVPDLTLLQRTKNNKIGWRDNSLILVESNGMVILNHYDILVSGCNINVQWYPFDTQFCVLTFANPAYDPSELNIECPDVDEMGENADNIENDQWQITKVSRDCETSNMTGSETAVLNFKIAMKRKPLYHLFNLVFPCFVITLICALVFVLPPEGDKISLALTILLAIVVFMNLIYDKMPVSADSVPLLTQYFAICLFLVTASCVLAVFVSRCGAFREASLVPQVPGCLKRFFIYKLGKVLMPHFIAVYNKKHGQASTCRVVNANVNVNSEGEMSAEGEEGADDDKAMERLQQEWYLLALVIDRFSLWIYLAFTVVSFSFYVVYGFIRLITE